MKNISKPVEQRKVTCFQFAEETELWQPKRWRVSRILYAISVKWKGENLCAGASRLVGYRSEGRLEVSHALKPFIFTSNSPMCAIPPLLNQGRWWSKQLLYQLGEVTYSCRHNTFSTPLQGHPRLHRFPPSSPSLLPVQHRLSSSFLVTWERAMCCGFLDRLFFYLWRYST